MSNIYGQKCLSQSKVFPVGRAPVFSELCDVCPNKLASWKIIHVVAVVLSDREKATQSPWAEFMMSLRWWDFQLNPLPCSTDLYFCFPGIHLIHRHVSCNFRQGSFETWKAFSLSQIEGNGGEFVELVPESLDYLGPQDLTQYFIRWLKQKWKTKSNSFLLLVSSCLSKIKLCFSRRTNMTRSVYGGVEVQVLSCSGWKIKAKFALCGIWKWTQMLNSRLCWEGGSLEPYWLSTYQLLFWFVH